MKARDAVPQRVVRKLRAPTGKKGPFFALQSVNLLSEIRIGEQRMEGEERKLMKSKSAVERPQLCPETSGKLS